MHRTSDPMARPPSRAEPPSRAGGLRCRSPTSGRRGRSRRPPGRASVGRGARLRWRTVRRHRPRSRPPRRAGRCTRASCQPRAPDDRRSVRLAGQCGSRPTCGPNPCLSAPGDAALRSWQMSGTELRGSRRDQLASGRRRREQQPLTRDALQGTCPSIRETKVRPHDQVFDRRGHEDFARVREGHDHEPRCGPRSPRCRHRPARSLPCATRRALRSPARGRHGRRPGRTRLPGPVRRTWRRSHRPSCRSRDPSPARCGHGRWCCVRRGGRASVGHPPRRLARSTRRYR